MGGILKMARARPGEANQIQLTPAATKRFTDRLARMRGAAMKMGQLMSMDGSDLFSAEAAEIMSALRDRADPMPMSQLTALLQAEWGRNWNHRFKRFEFQPIAAASIGQVHRAQTRDGRHLAVKVQFPGVRESIDSDIDNLGFLARTLGMVPKQVDLQPMLSEARLQLRQEADYMAEANSLDAYRTLIDDDPDFFVPAVHRDLTTSRILAMDFADGVSIERLAGPEFTRAERERAAELLCRLMLRELFEFGLVQTDPNFANYLYDPGSQRVVLLDFGATKTLSNELAGTYLLLGRAAVSDDLAKIRDGAMALGYITRDESPERVAELVGLIRLSGEVLQAGGAYDFGTSDLFERVFSRGRDLYLDDAFSQMPDPATLFLHRKFVGIFMLCRRLRARVDLRAMLDEYL